MSINIIQIPQTFKSKAIIRSQSKRFPSNLNQSVTIIFRSVPLPVYMIIKFYGSFHRGGKLASLLSYQDLGGFLLV